MSEQDYGYSSEPSGNGDQSSEDEDVAIEVEPNVSESIEVSIDDLIADGYELPPDDQQYIA